jgi:hypothetical protein
VFGADRRTVALRDFFAIAVLALGAAALFRWHLRRAEPPPAPAPPAPPAPEPPPVEPPSAPRPTRTAVKKARAPRKKSTG